ncbi:hypothetical protein [Botrimarina hoheduenensis]|uniref:Uncharacterized protein n=1 Tax=Botrimarina hoheduenensis TaxID=2528000 RepID=A0A5C5VYU3_9BACT|nr:hypothetical protein [Botrimarina hoheduenensis]TWT42929.1 hypothetical protein Pla111_25670 [Botrimarina hoheduenensis]
MDVLKKGRATAAVLAGLLGFSAGAYSQPDSATWALADQSPVSAAMPAAGNPVAGGLQWQILQNPSGPPLMLILDPVRQVVAVYQVDSALGVITLKSVRRIAYDLRLEAFNATEPTPAAIQKRTE